MALSIEEMMVNLHHARAMRDKIDERANPQEYEKWDGKCEEWARQIYAARYEQRCAMDELIAEIQRFNNPTA